MTATTASQRALRALSQTSTMHDILASADRDFLAALVAAGGPLPEQYAELDECLSRLCQHSEREQLPAGTLRAALIGLGGAFADPTSLVGKVLHARRHGVFGLMEDIYSNRRSEDAALHRWDAWFQRCAAAEAVRRRKDFLVGYLGGVASSVPTGSTVAVLGCGSCREVLEHLDDTGPRLSFDCIDIDKEALSFAKSLRKPEHRRSVRLLNSNALRFRPRRRYVRILSAGLFDYLSDRSFLLLLKQLGSALRPGGELLIGNFSPNNVTRGPMGCAGWVLRERSADELLGLARAAGYSPHQAWVGSEESGINLFLNVRVPHW